MNNELCNICPNSCNIDRSKDLGMCMASDNAKVALACLHFNEEPCISGTNGSGTVFFSRCNLKCIYCQNYKISEEGVGKEVSKEELANIFLRLQEKNANNINLVSPTIYVETIAKAIVIARKKGLNIQIIYNTNAYETVESLKLLDGLIDVYLPDFKYAIDSLANKYSKVIDYYITALAAIKEMYRQVGKVRLNDNGLITNGVIIRHLILPNYVENTKKVIDCIKEDFGDDVYISIMAQYFPTNKAKEDGKLNRKITKEEYKEVEEYLFSTNLENGYIQELGEHEEEYVPNFDLSGI